MDYPDPPEHLIAATLWGVLERGLPHSRAYVGSVAAHVDERLERDALAREWLARELLREVRELAARMQIGPGHTEHAFIVDSSGAELKELLEDRLSRLGTHISTWTLTSTSRLRRVGSTSSGTVRLFWA